jgi:glutamine phosphoribosylpyrophosphate amidotransferase
MVSLEYGGDIKDVQDLLKYNDTEFINGYLSADGYQYIDGEMLNDYIEETETHIKGDTTVGDGAW